MLELYMDKLIDLFATNKDVSFMALYTRISQSSVLILFVS